MFSFPSARVFGFEGRDILETEECSQPTLAEANITQLRNSSSQSLDRASNLCYP